MAFFSFLAARPRFGDCLDELRGGCSQGVSAVFRIVQPINPGTR